VRRLVPFVLLAGVLIAGAAGALLGARLADAATRPGHEELVIAAPALAAGAAPDALRAPGGFTGFGGTPALTGAVVRAGTVASVDTDAHTITIDAPGSQATVRYSSTVRLFDLKPIAGALAPGDVVVVRFQGDGPVGVMRVPGDLEEGVGASKTPRERGAPIIPPP
jgi:hypothetical protein